VTIFIFFPLLFAAFLVAIVGIIVFNLIKKKQLPDNYYTPFDYITSQQLPEYHVEKEERKQENRQDDDKDKNMKP
jgi:hypothetical protein